VVANASTAGRVTPVDRAGTRFGAIAGLISIVVGSAIVRVIAAVAHAAPGYFPDEYVYAAISRSLGLHGRPTVRGGPAHFPALLEPLLAAPIWRYASVETAYHLVQAENAVFMSLAAIPVYGLARRLRFGTGYSLAAAAFAVAIPDLAYAGYIVADPLGYTLALTALYAGVVALERPGRGVQLAFVVLTGLATFTRIQYVVLLPAYLAAAAVLDRRRAFRRHLLPVAFLGFAAAAVAAIGAGRIAGYYHGVASSHVGLGLLRWLGLELFFLTLAGGVVLVPGAVAGVVRCRQRNEQAFAALVIPFTAALLIEGALYASNNDIPRFKERYLMALLPLLPLAFGLYLRRGRPGKLPITIAAAGLTAVAAALPLSGYAAGVGFDDSPMLWSFVTAQWQFGLANASLVFAAYATVGAGLAVLVAWGRLPGGAALGISLAAVIALSVGATRFDHVFASQINGHLVSTSPSWVDAARVGPVSAVETDNAPTAPLLMQLFWNPSIENELILGTQAIPTDAFVTKQIVIGHDGLLRVGGRPLATSILFQDFQVTPVLQGFARVGKVGSFTLWKLTGTPRMRLLESGRSGDGWLNVIGTLRVWPGPEKVGTVSFTLSLPRSQPTPVTMRFGSRTYRLMPGTSRIVRIRVHAAASPWSIHFSVVSGASVIDNRPVTVQSTVPTFTAR
jgi:hypothetical protein